jgi:uncharacterized protein YndB with AHSA1/START domain
VNSPSPVRVERHVPVPPETVWPYLSDGALWARWQGVRAHVDPRPGGACEIEMPNGTTASGKVLEADPPRRLVFTWGFGGAPADMAPGSSMVEITLTPTGDGTLIALVHRHLPDPVQSDHEKGWHHYLDRLAHLVTGNDPGPDQGP